MSFQSKKRCMRSIYLAIAAIVVTSIATSCGEPTYEFTCADGRSMSVPASEYESIAVASAEGCAAPAEASEDDTESATPADSKRTITCASGKQNLVDLDNYEGNYMKARAAVCVDSTTTTRSARAEEGTIQNPFPANGTVEVTMEDSASGDKWTFTITSIRTISDLNDPYIAELSGGEEEMRDGYVLVAATAELRHDDGPGDSTYPPFDAFVVDTSGITHNQDTNIVFEWSDGSSVYPPTLPPGTKGIWTPVAQLPAASADDAKFAIYIFGGEPQYFAN